MLPENRVRKINKDIMNPVVPSTPRSTSGRTRPGWENSLNTENEHSNGIVPQTGIVSKMRRSEGTSRRFHRIYLYDITVLWSELEQIMPKLNQLKKKSLCIMGPQAQENPDGPGMKQDWMLTQRILGLNSGMGTRIKKILSSTNSEEELTYRTCCGGWIVTQSWWKSKGAREYSGLQKFGLLPIFTPKTGTQASTEKL